MRISHPSRISYAAIAGSILTGSLFFVLFTFGGAASADDPSIDIVAIDSDPSGNTATHIDTIDSCVSVPGPGTTFSIDLVVDQVPSTGAVAIASNILYDPSVVNITGIDFNYLLASAGPMTVFEVTDPLPDTDGNFREDFADLSPNYESGPGVLARVTLQAVGTGSTNLTLDEQVSGAGVPTIDDRNGIPYAVNNVLGATVAVGRPCSAETDLLATAATISAPSSAIVNTPFDVTAGGTIVNNGPITPVNANGVVSLSTPPDCTASGGSSRTISGLSLPAGAPVTIPDQTFSVSCTSPSFHTFTNRVSVVLADPTATETSLSNNQVSSTSATLGVLANADLSLTFGSITSTAAATATPMAGIAFQVVANLAVHNAGPDGPIGVNGTAALTVPSDCALYPGNPSVFTAQPASGGAVPASPAWTVTCHNPGEHTFSVAASVSASDIHVSDAPGNNSASGSGTTTVKVGACGADPAPAGSLIQNLSPQLLLLIQSLTATGTPVASNLTTQLSCNFVMTANDQANTPIDECAVALPTAAPCSLDFDLSIDMAGGSPISEGTVRLNPVGVTFVPPAFDWANDTSIPNGTVTGSASFAIRTDAGISGVPCSIDASFPLTQAYEGGIQGNVPDSNKTSDLTNPNVWPNNLNAERALVEASFTPIAGLPTAVQLWSRTIAPLQVADQKIPLNILTWKVTNPVFEAVTGALWIVVPFPGDALNPDPAGAAGGNPDADNPPAPIVPVTYCTPHHVNLQFDGLAGSNTFLSCRQPGSQMAWNLVDPDAVNVTGDEGPRSDTSKCGLDADSDGLSADAETYWGTNALSADTDGDGVKDSPDNCKTISNAAQTDYDHDGTGDTCDPDADGDGVANATDKCPTTALNTAVDASGCSAAQVDRDGDGFCNPGALSTGPQACVPTDNCPNTANADQTDTDGDGAGDACDGCPATATVWAVPANDNDCDGFTNQAEAFMGTDPARACASTTTADDEPQPDVWPMDSNNDRLVGLADVAKYSSVFGSHSPGTPYAARFDLNGDGRITLSDVAMFSSYFGKRCSP